MEPPTPENVLCAPETPLCSGLLTSPLSSAPSSLMLDGSEIEVEAGEQSDSEEFEDDNEINNETIRTGKAYHTRRRKKLQRFVDTFRQVGWTIDHFIKAWVNDDCELKHRRYRTRLLRQKALRRALQSTEYDIADSVFSTMEREIDSLIGKTHFGIFNPADQLDIIDFQEAFKTIQTTAPMWHKLSTNFLRNARAHCKGYAVQHQTNEIPRRLFTITSIICHSRAKKRSNYFASLLDAYFIGSGVKRRVIETVSGLGLCHTYPQCKRLMAEIAKNEKV